MRIFHPETAAERTARDALLQDSLREGDAPFGIAAEYPLVLGAAGAWTSFCLEVDGRVAAHANLWPRQLAGLRVGLIGNVATDAESRGQGLMRSLFARLFEEARREDLAALFLWSDLDSFYQKLGFGSCGRELRLTYQVKKLPAPSDWRPADPRRADPGRLLALRYAYEPTLARSAAEFAAQLTIPAMTLCEHDAGYTLMGKGADMIGVVHEWGAPNPQTLLAGVAAAARAAGHEQVMLLAPAGIDPAWRKALSRAAEHREEAAMAWMRCERDTARAALSQAFVWGLDSI